MSSSELNLIFCPKGTRLGGNAAVVNWVSSSPPINGDVEKWARTSLLLPLYLVCWGVCLADSPRLDGRKIHNLFLLNSSFADVVAAEKGEGRRRPTAQQVKYGIYQSLGNWVSVKLIFSSASKGRIRNIGRLANFFSLNCKAGLPLWDGVQETRTSFA